MFETKNIGVCFLLTILTCGIYGFYWIYTITNEMNVATGDNSISPTTAILFTILTCGIYGLYWAYKMGQNIRVIKEAQGLHGEENGVLYIILSFFGLSLVVYALIQSELNAFYASQNN